VRARMARKIRQLADGCRYPLESLVERFSDGRNGGSRKNSTRARVKLIEA